MRAEEDGVGPEVRGASLNSLGDASLRVREAPAFVYQREGLIMRRDNVVA